MTTFNLEYLAGQLKSATHIVSMFVEHATRQMAPEALRPTGLDPRTSLYLFDEGDVNALVHAAYEAERFAGEVQDAVEAELKAGGSQ